MYLAGPVVALHSATQEEPFRETSIDLTEIYLYQCTGVNDSIVYSPIKLLAEQNIVANTGRKDPGLLREVT